MISIENPICLASTADVCGEGAVWHAGEQSLYWTDINRFLIHRLDLDSNCVKTWFFDEPVTALVLTGRDDTLAVILGSRVILWTPKEDTRHDLGLSLYGWPSVRYNDAGADPRGSLWIGSMANNVKPDGSTGSVDGSRGVLIPVDSDGSISEWKRNIGIANTLVWNPERTCFFTADTLANSIFVYEYKQKTGSLQNERPFFVGCDRGLPDGSTMDSEGYLWNCRYGGQCIIRIAPNGTIDRVIEMPTPNVTNCTFGGPDLSTLFVTTASAGTEPGDRFAGGLFAIRTSVRGQPENRFIYPGPCPFPPLG